MVGRERKGGGGEGGVRGRRRGRGGVVGWIDRWTSSKKVSNLPLKPRMQKA